MSSARTRHRGVKKKALPVSEAACRVADYGFLSLAFPLMFVRGASARSAAPGQYTTGSETFRPLLTFVCGCGPRFRVAAWDGETCADCASGWRQSLRRFRSVALARSPGKRLTVRSPFLPLDLVSLADSGSAESREYCLGGESQ